MRSLTGRRGGTSRPALGAAAGCKARARAWHSAPPHSPWAVRAAAHRSGAAAGGGRRQGSQKGTKAQFGAVCLANCRLRSPNWGFCAILLSLGADRCAPMGALATSCAVGTRPLWGRQPPTALSGGLRPRTPAGTPGTRRGACGTPPTRSAALPRGRCGGRALAHCPHPPPIGGGSLRLCGAAPTADRRERGSHCPDNDTIAPGTISSGGALVC